MTHHPYLDGHLGQSGTRYRPQFYKVGLLPSPLSIRGNWTESTERTVSCGNYLPTQSQASYHSASSSPSARRPSSGFDGVNEEADVRANATVVDGHADVRASAVMSAIEKYLSFTFRPPRKAATAYVGSSNNNSLRALPSGLQCEGCRLWLPFLTARSMTSIEEMSDLDSLRTLAE